MGRVVAIICEVNPLHEGHVALFQKARELSENGYVIAIMSGNFVQRGMPAVFDKYTRAQSLLSCGVDLVLELPFPYSSSRATHFASAGVYIAHSVGADLLLFGSESGNLAFVESLADVYGHPTLSEKRNKTEMTSGEQLIMQEIIHKLNPSLPAALGSNDRLGAAYINECRKYQLEYQVFPRVCKDKVPSASEIRASFNEGRVEEALSQVAVCAQNSYVDAMNSLGNPVNEHISQNAIFSSLIGKITISESLEECSSGVSQRIIKIRDDSKDGTSFYEKLQTKRYTRSRLNRACLFSLLEVDSSFFDSNPGYSIVLAMGGRGAEYLSSIRKKCLLPLITKPASIQKHKQEIKSQFELERRADRFYLRLLSKESDMSFMMKQSPRRAGDDL